MTMTLQAITETLPEYAKDLALNLSSGLRQTELSQTQLWGTLVSCAMACRNDTLLQAVLAEASAKLSSVELSAAKAAAAMMGMNNIYYRFLHLAENPRYQEIPARLRMNILRTHGAEAKDFELWSLAVSSINGCGMCVASHDKKLREQGVGEETVAAAVRVAATLHAIASVLEAERVA